MLPRKFCSLFVLFLCSFDEIVACLLAFRECTGSPQRFQDLPLLGVFLSFFLSFAFPPIFRIVYMSYLRMWNKKNNEYEKRKKRKGGRMEIYVSEAEEENSDSSTRLTRIYILTMAGVTSTVCVFHFVISWVVLSHPLN